MCWIKGLYLIQGELSTFCTNPVASWSVQSGEQVLRVWSVNVESRNKSLIMVCAYQPSSCSAAELSSDSLYNSFNCRHLLDWWFAHLPLQVLFQSGLTVWVLREPSGPAVLCPSCYNLCSSMRPLWKKHAFKGTVHLKNTNSSFSHPRLVLNLYEFFVERYLEVWL